MTNKEAIEILKSKMDGSIDTSYFWCEAIRLAIQALEYEKEVFKLQTLLKEREEEIENLKQTCQSMIEGAYLIKEQEAVEPKINEDGEAFCECGENVGIIPNNKQLPSVRMKFCPECGKPILWEGL